MRGGDKREGDEVKKRKERSAERRLSKCASIKSGNRREDPTENVKIRLDPFLEKRGGEGIQ